MAMGHKSQGVWMLTAQSRRIGREVASQLSEQGQQHPARTAAKCYRKPEEGPSPPQPCCPAPDLKGESQTGGTQRKLCPHPPPSSVAHHG